LICSNANSKSNGDQREGSRDHYDVEAKAERHLRQHQVQSSVDVIDAELIQRLTPVDQTEYETQQLQHISHTYH